MKIEYTLKRLILLMLITESASDQNLSYYILVSSFRHLLIGLMRRPDAAIAYHSLP